MNQSFNYSGFIELFLTSDDEFEPYGCIDNITSTLEAGRLARSKQPKQHRERLLEEPNDK